MPLTRQDEIRVCVCFIGHSPCSRSPTLPRLLPRPAGPSQQLLALRTSTPACHDRPCRWADNSVGAVFSASRKTPRVPPHHPVASACARGNATTPRHPALSGRSTPGSSPPDAPFHRSHGACRTVLHCPLRHREKPLHPACSAGCTVSRSDTAQWANTV